MLSRSLMSRTLAPCSVSRKLLYLIPLSLAALMPASAPGKTPPAKRDRHAEGVKVAAQQVQEALQREIYGLESDRERLLREAATKSPDFAPAMWQLGYLKDQRNRWVPADDYLQQGTLAAQLAPYQRQRDRTPDTVAGQLALAAWCKEEGLAPQMRAHLSRVLELDANQPDARRELGYIRAGGQWVSREERETDEMLARAEQASLTQWRGTMEEIRAGLLQRSLAKQQGAAARLRGLRDPSTIPAMEAIISPASDNAAKVVVEVLGSLSDPAASLSLARHAIYYPSHEVRAAAAKQLSPRDKFSYVPQLVGMMYSPVDSRFVATVLPSGRIGYRHAFVREGQDRREILVLDLEYFRVAQNGGSGSDSAARAVVDAALTAAQRESGVRAQNEFQMQLNDRISWTLNQATGQNLAAQPETWWTWWNDYNELLIQGPKTLQVSQQYRPVAVVDVVQDAGNGSVGGGSGQTMAVGECLVAGTPIWTATGMVAVEKVRVGDLVLSQNAETGELALQPVLRTTVRPKGRTIQFVAGGESFQASGGHLFWVAGDGWRKASELQSGMVLHSLGGPVRISTVESGSEATTYNLVVADFSTYLVGKQKVLSHDFTMRQPNRALVPGLKLE